MVYCYYKPASKDTTKSWKETDLSGDVEATALAGIERLIFEPVSAVDSLELVC